MDAATTSLTPANSTRGEWAQFAAFLKRPVLPPRAPLPRLASLVATGRMLVLDLAVMGALVALAGLAMSAGIDMPETALAGVDLDTATIVAVVIVAPVLEELAFRSWLSGRPGHVLGVLVALPAAALAAVGFAAIAPGGLGTIWLSVLAGFVVALLVALATAYALRRRDAMRWFRRAFPLFFWGSTLAFAGVHLLNFPEDQLAMALPLILPQFATGAMLGYLRVNYGLWASMLLHALHNGAIIALVLLAGSAAG